MESKYKGRASKRISRSVSREIVSVFQEDEIRQMIREEIEEWWSNLSKEEIGSFAGDTKCLSTNSNVIVADTSSTYTGNSKTAVVQQGARTVTGKHKK